MCACRSRTRQRGSTGSYREQKCERVRLRSAPAAIGRHAGPARRIPKNSSGVSKLHPRRADLRIAFGRSRIGIRFGVEVELYSR